MVSAPSSSSRQRNDVNKSMVSASTVQPNDGKETNSKFKDEKKSSGSEIDVFGWVLLAIVIAITIFTYPSIDSWKVKVTEMHVFYYGWVTAVSTGLGAIPFLFFSQPKKFWMGVTNG